MSRRSAADTVARVLVALLRQRTWSQAELARAVEVQPRALRKRLDELLAAGVPLEQEADHPHVYWSVPRSWFPGGAALEAADAQLVARLLARLPKSAERERVLGQLLSALPAVSALGRRNERAESAPANVLAVVEDGSARHVTIALRYFTASRGDRGDRHVSVHRLEYGDRPRFLATCHREQRFKWFRLDRVEAAQLSPSEPFRDADPGELEDHLTTTVGGYRGPGAVVACSFRVRRPEARWLVDSMPAGLIAEHVADGIRVRARAAALEVVARYVVGLGDAAVCETPELRAAVSDIAQRALAANQSPRKVNRGSVGLKRRAV